MHLIALVHDKPRQLTASLYLCVRPVWSNREAQQSFRLVLGQTEFPAASTQAIGATDAT